MYHTYRVTFQNDEGKRKSFKTEASGIIPAIENAVRMGFAAGCFGWDIVKAEEMKK